MTHPRRSRLSIPSREEMAAAIFAVRPAGDAWTPGDAQAIAHAVFDLIVTHNAPPMRSCRHGHGPLQGFQIRKSGKSQRFCLVCDVAKKKQQRETARGEKKIGTQKTVDELVARRLTKQRESKNSR